MARRLLMVLVAFVFLAAGCGDDDGDDSGSSNGTETTASDTSAADDEGADDTTDSGDDDGASGGEAASGEPIKIGNVTSYSGPNIFPESATIAHLVFDRYNESGGLDGRPIELVDADAQDTVEGAAAAAKQLLEEEEVLGFCCGGSIVDCTTNAGYYEENDVEALIGVAACAEAPTVHPINTGPFLPTLHAFDFFLYDLGIEKICFAGENVGLTPIFLDTFIPLWEESSGVEINTVISEVGEDLTPSVTKIAADGCEAVLVGFTEPQYQSFFQIVSAQGLRDDIVWSMLTSGYSLGLLDAAGDTLEGVYAASEFEPYTGDESQFSDDVEDFLSLVEAADETPTSFGQGGYMAAQAMIQALESIDGELTFESVNEAISNISYETPMLGGPFTATGFVGGEQPNPYSLMVQVQDGEFQRVNDFQIFPREEAQG